MGEIGLHMFCVEMDLAGPANRRGTAAAPADCVPSVERTRDLGVGTTMPPRLPAGPLLLRVAMGHWPSVG
jgi:hypothetical protein